MDIESREKALLQKNASISATSSPKLESKLPRSVSIQSLSNASPKLESKLPRMVSVESLGSPKLEPKLQRRVSMERNRHPSDSSSISSINTPISIKDGSLGPGGGAISKTKKSLKKVNLAVVKQRKKDMGNLELLKTLDEYKRENNRLGDEIKKITRDKDQIQSQIAKMQKKEEKVKHELESNTLRMKEAEGEAQMLKTICERQERELKQRDSSAKSDGVRLTRQEEQINKQRIEQHKLGEANAGLREELRVLKDLHQKHVNLKDKQIEQLLDGFQKQMQLIDVLRRQKLHLEAAHILQYTEDEFLQTLDWKPFGNEGGGSDKKQLLVNQSG